MWKGFKDIWGADTSVGLIAGVLFTLGCFDLFDGDYWWAALNITSALGCYGLTLFRELRP